MTTAAAPQLAADARLDTFSSQRTFRSLLDALSRPGRLSRLHPPSGIPAALLPALALVDVDVTACVLTTSESADLGAVLATATGARLVPMEQADVVVALRPPTPDEIRSLRRGRADAPELGARLSVACTKVTGGDVQLILRGPGVPDLRTLDVGGLEPAVFDALVGVNRQFPTGIDTFLVADDGTVAGIPRSTNLEVR